MTADRLYVLWLMSSLLLVLLVVIVTLLGSGQLRRHAQRISEQTEAIEQLRTDVSRVREELAALEAAVTRAAGASREEAPAVDERGEAEPPVEERQPERQPRPAPPVVLADERAINTLLQSGLRPGEDGPDSLAELPYELADRGAAEEALRKALEEAGQASWGGETWSRLAVAARLLDRGESAEMFAGKAVAAGAFPQAYYELSARQLLAAGEAAEAVVFAKRLATGRPGHPEAVVLLAEAYCAHRDLANAVAAVEELDEVPSLSLSAKLRLGRVFVALESWDRLDRLVASLGRVPEPALPVVNYLRAVVAAQRGRPAVALAILDELLAESGTRGRGQLMPDDYDLRTWRGVALVYAGQFAAAREALSHSQEHPERPEAWYWCGILEVRAGNTEEAVAFFQHALAASQRFAPAWEALGAMALNAGELPMARQDLENALNADPRRASGHFLLAVVHAKMSQPRETAAALQAAFHRDPSLLESARETEVIRGMFSDDELASLANGESIAPAGAGEGGE